MFTGIIETVGQIDKIEREGSNIHFRVQSDISTDLKIDQSVAHDGVCLTVTKLEEGMHWVTAIDETLQKTNLQSWMLGRSVNLERCLQQGGRLDGHIVQGHVDTIGTCTEVVDKDGSWEFYIKHPAQIDFLTVKKGSICLNGTSLTVVRSDMDGFSVAIIPYTYEHTTFKFLKEGDLVNLEFDILGKYIQKIQAYTAHAG